MRAGLPALLLLVPAAVHAQPAGPYDQAVAARLAGNHAEALRLLEPLSVQQPHNADVWLLLGLTYTALGQLDDADAALATARELAPDYPDVITAQERLAQMRSGDDTPAWRTRVDAARQAGRHDEAVRLLEPLTREQPDNADIWLMLGLAYTAEERLDEADAALARAQEIAPDYQDVADARTRLVKMREGGPPKWRIDATAGYSSLSEELEPWRFASLHITRRFEDNWLTLGAEHSDRFGESDLFMEVLAARGFNSWSGYLALGGTPDADHRAEVSVRGGAIVSPAREGWSLRPGIDAFWARYPVGDVHGLQPGLTVENRTLSLRARWIATWDELGELRNGYALNGWWQVSSRWRLLASWADAAESADGMTVDVKAVSLGAAFDIDDFTAIRLDAVHDERDAYDSDAVSVGLTRRF